MFVLLLCLSVANYREEVEVTPITSSSSLVTFSFLLPPFPSLPDLHFLHLSMTKGKLPQSRSPKSHQSMTELLISPATPLNEYSFSQITSTLGSIFSSSLSTLRLSDRHRPSFISDNLYAFYDLTDSLCTENLYSLMKQLPCGDKSGLARALNKVRFFAAPFHSIDFDLSGVLSFSFLVMNEDLDEHVGVFSNDTLQPFNDFCGAANRTTMSLSSINITRGVPAVFDLSGENNFSLAFLDSLLPPVEKMVSVSRLVRGYGLMRRRVEVVFHNPTMEDVEIFYYDHFPYNVDVYYGSLFVEGVDEALLGYNLSFVPKSRTSSSTTREVVMRLKSGGRAVLSVEVMPLMSYYPDSMLLFHGNFRVGGGLGAVVRGGRVEYYLGSNVISLKAMVRDFYTVRSNLFITLFLFQLGISGVTKGVVFNCARGGEERSRSRLDKLIKNAASLGLVAIGAFACDLF